MYVRTYKSSQTAPAISGSIGSLRQSSETLHVRSERVLSVDAQMEFNGRTYMIIYSCNIIPLCLSFLFRFILLWY